MCNKLTVIIIQTVMMTLVLVGMPLNNAVNMSWGVVNSRAPDFQCFTNLGLVAHWSYASRKPRAPSCTAF